MTTPIDRFKKAIVDAFTVKPAPDEPTYGDRLRDWLSSFLVKGTNEFLESAEPGLKDLMHDSLMKIVDNPQTPPELRDAIKKGLELPDWEKTFSAWLWGLIGWIPALLSAGTHQGNLIGYDTAWLYPSFRLDPLSVITAWRRDPETYEKYFDDLRDQGWSDERIEALKFFTLFYPSPMDLVNWQAKEVFEPNMIAKYGLKDELGELRREDFYKAGMSDEQIDNFWMAHWEHPEFRTVVEMLRRTDFSEDDMKAWFRLVEIPPYWRDKLIQISYEVPTRVDVRRFWDMRTIDEARLREVYTHQGYHGKDLDDYVLWTKVYVAFPDLIARWKNGFITLDEVRAELTGYGMPADRLEELIETKMKATAGDQTAAERDITKTDIYKGVKQGVLTREEAIELLMELGYEEDTADYLLTINIPVDEEDVVVKERDLTKTDIIKGLKAEIITEEEALAKLLELRYAQLDAEFLLKIYKATIKPPAEAREREASKADIVLAVKKGLITAEEGYLMLQDIGFTPEASQFILMVKAEVSPFSPMSYQEFKDITGKWRKAAGVEGTPEAEALRQAAAEVVKLTRDLEVLKERVKDEERGLVAGKILPPGATAKVDELRVALHRAEATLAAAKSHYDALIAEWRHRG